VQGFKMQPAPEQTQPPETTVPATTAA